MFNPLHKHEGSNGRLSGEASAHARRHGGALGGSFPQIFFVPPQILLCSEIFFKYMIKIKIFPPKNAFCSSKP